MDWIATQLGNPLIAGAVAFVLGGLFNSVVSLATGEVAARREEKRAVARERRDNLRTDRLRKVEDTERWFRKWVDCLEEGTHEKIPDVADFPRRSHAVMADGELLLEWNELEDQMIQRPRGLTAAEHDRLVRIKNRILKHLELQRERALADEPLLEADERVLQLYWAHEPTGDDHHHP